MAKKIKMLKPGRFTAMNGKAVEFTEAHLVASAKAYDPELSACHFVLGHPKHDDPAFGRVGAADFSEGFLWGNPDKVDPAFAEAVNAGKFSKVSLSLYEPDSPHNPVPGVYYPRHLGFLGAMPPAVKGLGTVSFAEGETGVVEFGDWNDRTIARMFRSMKNFLIEKFSKEEADKVLDEWDLENITEDALRPEPITAEAEPSFAEPQGGANMLTTAQIAAKELEFQQRETALKTGEAALKTTLTGNIHTANLAFAEGLVTGGKLRATQKAAVVGLLDFAGGVTEGGTIEFGEGDAKKTQTPLQILQDVLSACPKIIEFGELGGGQLPGAQETAIPANLTSKV